MGPLGLGQPLGLQDLDLGPSPQIRDRTLPGQQALGHHHDHRRSVTRLPQRPLTGHPQRATRRPRPPTINTPIPPRPQTKVVSAHVV